MELFEQNPDPKINILPFDGMVNYYGRIYPVDDANILFQTLMTGISWQHDQSIIFGKRIVTKRMVAWHGDQPFPYRYSGTTKVALPWTATLQQIKSHIEAQTMESFNSCLLNLYHDGEEGMAWHSDGEPELKENGAIASVSLGAERRFAFKHKQSGDKINIMLNHGSLLVMRGTTQRHWLHRLPPTKSVKSPRINLTFRQINATT